MTAQPQNPSIVVPLTREPMGATKTWAATPERPTREYRIGRSALVMDPRTKLLLLLVVNVCVMTVVNTTVTFTALALVILLLAENRNWRVLLGFILLWLLFWGLHELTILVPHWLGAIISVVAKYGTRVLIVVASAVWMLTSTTPAAFVAALRRAHVPMAITVPVSVMFRFFPAAWVELRSIWDAMKLRGLFTSATQMAAHPMRAAEYITVPLIGATLQMADDLSASAMSRGLGQPNHPTSIARIGFGLGDLVGLAAGVTLITVFVLAWRGVV
ncbi:MAG: energy-coupling factor transporter transmembrane component T [Varibaculum sp.]|nr:energy-coupling factor transporter transmembrane component T [Varibaculum sp.]